MRRIFIALLLVLSPWLAETAEAGMPSVSITLSDLARWRLQTISFFLATFLLASAAIYYLWNRLGRDFPRLPRLRYRGACGLVALWGLLFVIVLTMISGARELMTPGAWEKHGMTYRLKSSPAAPESSRPAAAPPNYPAGEEAVPSPEAVRAELDTKRWAQLAALYVALTDYAAKHNGLFPPDKTASGIAAERWRIPDPSGLEYVYRTGSARKATDGNAPLACEPGSFDGDALVLLCDGKVDSMPPAKLRSLDPAKVDTAVGAKP